MTIESDEPLVEGGPDLPPGALSAPPPPEGLRERILAETTAVVRRRRGRIRLLRAAAAVALFAAGVAVGSLRRGEATPPEMPGASRTGTVPALPDDPRALAAHLADAPPAERARRFREAGDRYLAADRTDPVAALYCYRRLLDETPGNAPAPEVGDGWLLTYLKLADTEEIPR